MADDAANDVGQGAPLSPKSGTAPAKQALADAMWNLIDSAKAFIREEALNTVDGALAALDGGNKKPKKGE